MECDCGFCVSAARVTVIENGRVHIFVSCLFDTLRGDDGLGLTGDELNR